MARIQKYSFYLSVVLKVCIVLLPTYIFLLWVFIDTGSIKNLLNYGVLMRPIVGPEGVINFAEVPWTPLTKAIGCISQFLAALPLFLSLFALKSIFQNYQKGEIFSAENARKYRFCGSLFFLDALIAQPFSSMLEVIAVTLTQPPGHRYITLSIGTPNFEAVFCGVLVIVISWVMLEASQLHQEQQFTI